MDTGNLRDTLRQRAANVAQKLRLRRREPWNWCLQNACLALLPIALVLRNTALLALCALGLIAGCLELPLPPMQHTGFKDLLDKVEPFIGRECAWLARPLDGRKKRQIALLALGAPAAAWFLWQQDLAPIGAAIIIPFLLHIRRKNIEDGIEP